MFYDIKKEILNRYPLGGQWFDCVTKTDVIIRLHLLPRGLFVSAAGCQGPLFYNFSELLDGRLIKAVTDNDKMALIDQYREHCTAVREEYRKSLDTLSAEGGGP